jgi:uncharacterized RDD family membrane protein YckC
VTPLARGAQSASRGQSTSGTQPTSGYAGVVTRAVALGADAAAINVIALIAGAAISAILSLFGNNGGFSLGAVLAGWFAWTVWSGIYFITFWTFTGQTPGDRLLGIRVIGPAPDGQLSIARSTLRFFGLLLSIAPFFAGFLPVLFNDRRRGLHDWIADTVVRWGDSAEPEVITVAERAQISSPAASVKPGP